MGRFKESISNDYTNDFRPSENSENPMLHSPFLDPADDTSGCLVCADLLYILEIEAPTSLN